MRRLTVYIPAVVTALSILYLSLIRETHIPMPETPGLDKLGHAAMYTLLSLLWAYADLYNGRKTVVCVIMVIITCTVYGGLIELLQERYFYPRSGEWADWAADLMGSIVGTSIACILWNIRKKHII